MQHILGSLLIIRLDIIQLHLSFSHKDLGVTQSQHGNVYKVMNYEGQGSVHMLAEFKQIQACDLIHSSLLYASMLVVTQSWQLVALTQH